MPTTGLCLLPPASGNAPVSTKLIAHLSRRYPTQEHVLFHLEHRLFSDTSSQLPGSDVKQRCFTHVLSFSHDPQHAFVSSTKPGNSDESSTITIPAASADSFTGLISTKLQPAWYPRQMLSVENGVCVAIEEKGLVVCIGDARVSARSQGAGTVRGTVVELFRREDTGSDENNYTKEEAAEDEAWMQSALEGLFKGTGVTFNARIITGRTLPRKPEEGADVEAKRDWNLAKLYMAVFRR
ncbi:hypothetical protein PMZ80_000006 [Knufia obscura]|uniref:Mediator of RNA polymerase II transcription subunit 20 n=2 Tax=Knufia TaxID=430999 RepID=A0AAN8E991_9EURO|nr:hypothetical protein PMZ80_000006 [Knufia obscura]KAK5948813.1 hypothetical protein OHC33_010237 [Knufia fluminis]